MQATEEEKAKRRRRDKLRRMGRPNVVTEQEFARLRRRMETARRVYGMSARAVSEACPDRVDATTIKNVLNGEVRTVRRTTYNALMQVRMNYPDGRYAGAPVPAHGVHRRLRALQADGFTGRFLCGLLGVEKSSIPEYFGSDTVRSSTRRRTQELYDNLLDVSPEDVLPLKEVRRMRTLGRNRNWPGRACWDADTIDDPDAVPEWTGRCGTAYGHQIHRRENIPMCEPCRQAGPLAGYPGFDGAKLRWLRERAGLSLRDLQEASGVHARTIIGWEQGQYAPRYPRLDDVLVVLNVVVEDVTEGEGA